MVKVQSRPRRLVALAALALLTSMLVAIPTIASADGPAVFINEIHYDNDGTDAGEAVEVAGPAGTDLTGWTIVLYNGNGGGAYDTTTLSGTIPDQGSGYGTVSVTYPSNGIQNGSPDGLALVDDTAAVIEFLSYEGVIVAADGPAVGMTSTDIVVSEPYTTLVGDSLQLTGIGTAGGDFTWAAAQTNTFGAINTGQVFEAPADVPPVVGSTDPSDGAVAVAVDSDITITFSEPVTVTGDWYGISCSPSGTVTAVATGGPTAYILNPAADLTYDETCTVNVVAAQVSDQDGIPNAMEADFSFGFTITGEPSAPSPVVINEIDYDQPSTDTSEFVELYNASSSPVNLSTWTLELVNGKNGGATVYNTIVLPDVELAPGGFYVVCANAAMTPKCDLDSSPDTNFIQNGGPDAVGLRESGTLMDAVSYEGDTGAPYTEGSGAGLADSYSAANLGISRLVDGGDTNQNNVDFGPRCSTPGAANSSSSDNCVPPACLEVPVLIGVVQGSGTATPCAGATVTIEGVVVGDYEGPWPNLRGFYVQDEGDGDPATSDGIFVFNYSNDDVSLGDLVRVTGEVSEYHEQTQIGFPDALTVVGSGFSVTPGLPTLPVPDADHLERFEGMLVTMAQTLYVTEHYQLGRFGQVVVSSGDRLLQPTNVVTPGASANAMQAANDLNRLIVDDELNNQNRDPITYGRDGNELSAENTLRGGDTLTGATGVMTYTYSGSSSSGDAYRLRPQSSEEVGITFTAANPRPTAAPSVGGDLTVVSFNVLNYFLTVDGGPDICGPLQDQDCRGADSSFEFERQRTKLLAALEQVDADVLGLVELENTPGVSPEGDLVAGLGDSYAVVDVGGEGLVGDDTIRVGIIYRADSVTPLGDPEIYDFDLDPLGESRNRSALAQTFTENASGEVFTVVVNHFKSKSGSEIDNSGALCSVDPTYPDCDQGDGQAYFNATRTSAAEQIVDWLATEPTGVTDPDVMILGDLNAYAKEDPIALLESAGYVNLHSEFGNAYSYVFDGQWGFLDYALASSSLVAQITGAADYHINSDEPNVLDYNTNYQSDHHVVSLYAPDEYRTSDHDPVLVGLALDAIDATAAATPDMLWPPNHKYREVMVTADDGDEALVVFITGATSSEPDSGINEDDVPNDIVVTGDTTIDLRAERDDEGPGRIYTVVALAANESGQMQLVSTDVLVPHDKGNKKQKPK